MGVIAHVKTASGQWMKLATSTLTVLMELRGSSRARTISFLTTALEMGSTQMLLTGMDVPRRSCTGSPVPRASLSPGTLLSLIAGPSSLVLSTLTTTPDLVVVQSALYTILIARFVMSQRMCLHV